MQDDRVWDPGGSAEYSLQRRTCIALIILYPVLHVLAVWAGLFLSSGSQTATLWISNALLLAVMVILGKRWWLPLLLSLIAAEAFTVIFLSSHLPLPVALAFSAANMLEALVAALLWQTLVKDQTSIFRLRDCILLIFVVAVAAPAIGGLLAGVGRIGLGDGPAFFRFWQLWWAANLLGILVVTTTILAWAGTKRAYWKLLDSRRYELIALVVMVSGLALWVFGSAPGSVGTVLGFPYIVFPLLIWSTVRFGTPVSAVLVLAISIIAIINTDSGSGPYAIPTYTVYQRVLSLQMFLTAAAISALILGAAFSERRIALGFLQQSEAKFSKAFHASPHAIAIFRVSDGRVMDVNNSFHNVTGHSRDEAIGATLEQLNLGPLEEERRRFRAQGDSDGEPVRVTSTITARSGLNRECEIAYDTTEILGDLCTICILHDMTRIRAEEEKRHTAESQLMQARKMEALGQLTGGIAHDFNNILFSMLGNTELAEDRLAGSQDGQLQFHLKEIRDAGTRARDLVAQLLTFGRIQPANPLPVLISDVVDEVLRLLKQVLPSSLRINTVVRTQDVEACVDAVQLHQLILNLCVNARDATGGSGTIEIVVDSIQGFHGRCSSCQSVFEGDFARLSVCDSGPGIEPANLAKIFDPFYTSKDVGEGTGLGLSVVHGVVHSHGGHIVVDGTPGSTTVTVYFPQVPAEHEERVSPQVESAPYSEVGPLQAKVLLVDDEPAVCDVMARILEAHGMDVAVAASGVDALERLAADSNGFDIVITDQTMPHMTGVALAEKILAFRPDVPVILCSGYSADIDEQGAAELGISAYLQKPVEFPRLIAVVAKLLEA